MRSHRWSNSTRGTAVKTKALTKVTTRLMVATKPLTVASIKTSKFMDTGVKYPCSGYLPVLVSQLSMTKAKMKT